MRVPERMDADDVDPRELARALGFIRRINRWLGYNRVVCRAIADVIASLSASRRLSVLDVAAGSGDLFVELAAHVRRPLTLIALDRHRATIDEGIRQASEAGVRFVAGDALALPFADASVDVVVSTMFLHHLSDEQAIAAVREMRRVAREAVVIADLIRDARAFRWISLFTTFSSPMIRHDARASVAHAFTLGEMRRLVTDAGLADAQVTRTFAHRSLVAWQRVPGQSSASRG